MEASKSELSIVQTLPLPLAISNGQKEWVMVNESLLAHSHSHTSVQIHNVNNNKSNFIELEREYQRIFPLPGDSLAVIFSNEVRIYHFPEIDSITHKKTNAYVLTEDDNERIQNIKISPNKNFLIVYLKQSVLDSNKVAMIDLVNNTLVHSDMNFKTDYSRDYFILNSNQLAILDHLEGILFFNIKVSNANTLTLKRIQEQKAILKNENVTSITDCPNDLQACMHNAYSLSPNLILWKKDKELDFEKLLSVKNVNPFVEPMVYKDDLYFYNKSKELIRLDLKTLDSVSLGVVEGLLALHISPLGRFMVSHHNGVTIYQLD